MVLLQLAGRYAKQRRDAASKVRRLLKTGPVQRTTPWLQYDLFPGDRYIKMACRCLLRCSTQTVDP